MHILEKIKANHFLPHPDKIHYTLNFCEVTGLFVGSGELEMEPQMLEEAKKNENVRKYIVYVQRCYQKYKLKRNSLQFTK